MKPSYFFSLAQCLLLSLVYAQAPNTAAANNYNSRTASVNGTWFILPVDRAAVASIVAPYSLLNIPTSDKSLFPKGFPAGCHPVWINQAYMADIRLNALSTEDLLFSQVYVPYVDRLGNGMTPFNYAVRLFMAGTSGVDYVNVLVPAIAGTFSGTNIVAATMAPNDAAWQWVPPTQCAFGTKMVVVPNPASGPSVSPAAIDALMSMQKTTSNYTAHTFHEFMNQPVILTNGQCQRNAYYFNESFSDPVMRVGTVTLTAPAVPKAIAGNGLVGSATQYTNVYGYSGVAETIGYSNEDCALAYLNTDPKSRE